MVIFVYARIVIFLGLVDLLSIDNDASRNLNLNDYGILVLETKSIWAGKPDDFALISFVDFNNQRWSRDSRHRLEEFFVVGSSKDGTIPSCHSHLATSEAFRQFFSLFISEPTKTATTSVAIKPAVALEQDQKFRCLRSL
ncbi:hypothetical protein GCK32_007042 [Trichostrongylus colubriformis]|uniref:Uncharacterized protein n=1 Tax=Trichostrongylus colubriformis TaxID=6319 RepID=A0AAN8FM16_TRICO